ncbi:MAG TPA: 4-alpha-glucanotransferase [Vicinamibacterales bacterium]|nr:4-alpha-glucanotransferase [Vicinamibacterales bacterium]
MARVGIQRHYVDALGTRHEASAATLRAISRAMSTSPAAERPVTDREVVVVKEGHGGQVGRADVRLEDGTTIAVDRTLPHDLPLGYHEIVPRRGPSARLIVAPAACYLPAEYRTWGWAIQLYAARSRRSWGFGDLSDLRTLGRWAAGAGAGIALINPLAAAAPLLPQQPSPYFPSSRRFRNPLYLHVEDVPGAGGTPGLSSLAARGRALNRDRTIDRDAVFRLKMHALERIWPRVRGRRDPDFDAFIRDQDDGLTQFARFCALAERFGTGWHGWPSDVRHPDNPAVRQLTSDPALADRIRFHQWLQYAIDRQLARASAELPVMQDLPIGFDTDGADAWAFQDVIAHGISVGAPPDEFNTRGQDWGLPPFVPQKLRAAGYEPFVQTIRACLRHAGGLRIDHVMGLFRLYWIPSGMSPAEGTYVRHPADDLLAIVALESHRARAVIVGEDLGTVEDEVRRELKQRRILSYRLVWFEKMAPARFPAQALAAVTTHELPTIAGLWSGADLEAQRRLELSPNEASLREIRDRVGELTRSTRAPVETAIARVHEALATAPSRILTATLDDAMAVKERPNMPATTTEWPNWCLALPQPIETLAKNPLARRIAAALSRRRPSNPASRPRRSQEGKMQI